MNELFTLIFNGVNFSIAFLVWGCIRVARKSLGNLKYAKIIYLLSSICLSLLLSWLYFLKVKAALSTVSISDFGFTAVTVFVLANLYQKTLKQIADRAGSEMLKNIIAPKAKE